MVDEVTPFYRYVHCGWECVTRPLIDLLPFRLIVFSLPRLACESRFLNCGSYITIQLPFVISSAIFSTDFDLLRGALKKYQTESTKACMKNPCSGRKLYEILKNLLIHVLVSFDRVSALPVKAFHVPEYFYIKLL